MEVMIISEVRILMLMERHTASMRMDHLLVVIRGDIVEAHEMIHTQLQIRNN